MKEKTDKFFVTGGGQQFPTVFQTECSDAVIEKFAELGDVMIQLVGEITWSDLRDRYVKEIVTIGNCMQLLLAMQTAGNRNGDWRRGAEGTNAGAFWKQCACMRYSVCPAVGGVDSALKYTFSAQQLARVFVRLFTEEQRGDAEFVNARAAFLADNAIRTDVMVDRLVALLSRDGGTFIAAAMSSVTPAVSLRKFKKVSAKNI